MLWLAALAVMLPLLFTTTVTEAQSFFKDADLSILNASLETAKGKLSPTYYFFDDPSPGEYFDNITMATRLLTKALSDRGTWNGRRTPFISFFKEISSNMDEQAAPFGVEPATVGTVRVLTSKLELGLSFDSPAVNVNDLFANLRTVCETLHGRPKVSEALVGEHCQESLGDEDSEAQAMKTKMFMYAKENGFEDNESNCLHLFVARYTKSAEAIQMFKLSFDRHFLAWATMEAFCAVITSEHSHDANRAKVLEMHASFSRSLARTSDVQIEKSKSWTCDDEQSASEMPQSFANRKPSKKPGALKVNLSRLDEIVEDAVHKFSNTHANDLFIDNPAVADYFDSISTAALFLEVALKTARSVEDFWFYETLRSKYYEITGAVDKMFDDSSRKADAQTAPLGLRECGLLPKQLRNYTISPIAGEILDAFTGDAGWGYGKTYNYDTLRAQCATTTVEESLEALKALVGEDCDKGVRRNGSVDEAIQDDMMQYARNHSFEGADEENRCLQVFIARYKKSDDAVTQFKMSLDKYYMAMVTVQAFCSVFVPTCNKETFRTKMSATHSSLAKSLARVNASQFTDKEPLKCETKSEELLANMSASCDELEWKVELTTYFLGNQTAEEYVNTTFEMVDALRSVDKDTSAWREEARTQREAEVRKKTRQGVLDRMAGLLKSLKEAHGILAKPFGSDDWVVLLPEAVDFEVPSLYSDRLAWAVGWARKSVDVGKIDAIDNDIRSVCDGRKIQPEKTLGRLVEPMTAGCETRLDQSSDDDEETLAAKMMTYAMSHGFDGCEDNKCLQIFITRYRKYDSRAIGELKKSVAKYALLSRLVEPMTAGCETRLDQSSDDDEETLAAKMMTYAMSHGFDGCEDNKCLQIFITRYRKYDSRAIGELKKSVAKYALLSVVLQAFCASALEDPVRQNDTRLKTVELVGSPKNAMDLIDNLLSKADIYKPCTASYPAWISEVEAIAKQVIDNATGSLNTSSWEDRQGLNKLVAERIVAKLDASTYADGYNFKALAYLPFTDDGQHAFLSLPVVAEDVIRNDSKLMQYVVSRHRKRATQSMTLLRKKWDAIESNGNEILDAAFSTSATNLSRRIEEVERRFAKDINGPFLSADGFRALVALRCGYVFVWYELGYRYFPAGFTTDDYVLATEQSNKYKYNCGQIVFFA